MAKRGGLGRGLDSLIPDRSGGKTEKTEKSKKKSTGTKKKSEDKNTESSKKSTEKSAAVLKDLEKAAAEKAEAKKAEIKQEETGKETPAETAKKRTAASGTRTGSRTGVSRTRTSVSKAKPVAKTTAGTKITEPAAVTDDSANDVETAVQTAATEAEAVKTEVQTKKASEPGKTGSAKKAAVDTGSAGAASVDAGFEKETEISTSKDNSKAAEAEETAETGSKEQAPADNAGKSAAKTSAKPVTSASAEPHEGEVVELNISIVEPNRDQPRKYFDDAAIEELADSVRQFGIIQPLLVQKKDDYYEIIAGERRWRAARKAGLKTVPAIIRRFSNQEAVEVALIENLQREDLNPIEEAKAYERLVKEYGLSQEAVAGRVSKSRSAVTNSMRLLKLETSVQGMVETGAISEGHARAILGVTEPEKQAEIAARIVTDQLSVRQTEKLVRDSGSTRRSRKRIEKVTEEEFLLKQLAEQLKTGLGTNVRIRPGKNNGGCIEIDYYSADDLDRLYLLLKSVSES